MAEYEKPSLFQVTVVIVITIIAAVSWLSYLTSKNPSKELLTSAIILSAVAIFGWNVISKSSKEK